MNTPESTPYTIVQNTSAHGFIEDINRLISLGYVPHGESQLIPSALSDAVEIYYQAMINPTMLQAVHEASTSTKN